MEDITEFTQVYEIKPLPSHTAEYYEILQEVREKGSRRKKGDPYTMVVRRIAWAVFNQTELVQLARSSAQNDPVKEVKYLQHVYHATPREDLIAAILGKLDPLELPKNPIDKERRKMQKLFDENWSILKSQITCNTFCWGCPDATAMQCTFLNRRNLPNR